MDSFGAGAWIALFLSVASGSAYLGWRIRQAREAARRGDYEAAIREQIKAAGCARDRAKAEQLEAEDRFVRLREEHSNSEIRMRRLETSSASRDADLASLADELRQRDDRLAQLELRAESDREELAALTEQLAALKRLRSELAAAEKVHSGCGKREQELKERSETLQGRLEVSERLREESAPRWLMSAPKGSKDDLKEIRGLGPTLERNLNRLGIFHFHQLARMTSKDAHWIAGRINAFTGLNKRYRWVEQARLRKGRIVGRPGGNGARAREDH